MEGVREASVTVWCALLDNARGSDDEDFFALGGDSLDLLRLLYELSANVGVEIELHDFMTNPTLGNLVAITQQAVATNSAR